MDLIILDLSLYFKNEEGGNNMPSYMHVGNENNIDNKIKSIYIGNSNNIAEVAKSVFMGNSDGKATGAYQRMYTTTVTYYTSAIAPGNMSSTTALTRESTSGTSYLTSADISSSFNFTYDWGDVTYTTGSSSNKSNTTIGSLSYILSSHSAFGDIELNDFGISLITSYMPGQSTTVDCKLIIGADKDKLTSTNSYIKADKISYSVTSSNINSSSFSFRIPSTYIITKSNKVISSYYSYTSSSNGSIISSNTFKTSETTFQSVTTTANISYTKVTVSYYTSNPPASSTIAHLSTVTNSVFLFPDYMSRRLNATDVETFVNTVTWENSSSIIGQTFSYTSTSYSSRSTEDASRVSSGTSSRFNTRGFWINTAGQILTTGTSYLTCESTSAYSGVSSYTCTSE